MWRYVSNIGNHADVHVPESMKEEFEGFIRNAGLSFSVIIENLQDAMEKEKASNLMYAGESFDYQRYNTYANVSANEN